MSKLRVLQVSGAPYELGYIHGKAFAREIGRLTEERLHLSCDPFWTGGQQATLDEVLALGQICLRYHQEFDPGLMEEMQGMADATGIGVNELVIMNGFTDFVDIVANPAVLHHQRSPAVAPGEDFDGGGCTAFVIAPSATEDGQGYLGQTWDMHSTATPYVALLDVRPDQGPSLLTFTITGCVGMIGMNEHGVAVGINNLLGADGRPGVHWVYVVRKMLAQRTVDAALAVLRGAHLSGAHNYLLLGPDAGGEVHGYNVEQMATRAHVAPVEGVYAHANHCLISEMTAIERPRTSVSHASTQARYAQAAAHLGSSSGHITLDSLMALTRLHEGDDLSICAHVQPGYDVESSGACIMAPHSRQLWALWGNPCQNEYEAFTVGNVTGVTLSR
jgi:isopenicillin-N N-acyltransferase like protein